MGQTYYIVSYTNRSSWGWGYKHFRSLRSMVRFLKTDEVIKVKSIKEVK